MSQIRKVECVDAAGRDFAPSEMFLLVLTQDETAIMYNAAVMWNIDKDQALQKIVNAGLLMLREVAS